MRNASHIGPGIITGGTLTTLSYLYPIFELLVFIVAIVVLIATLIFGRALPLSLRVLFIVILLDLGIASCLAGRTMEPGLSFYTLSMAVLMFGIITMAPALALFKSFAKKQAILLIGCLLPVSLTVACLTAAYEEHKFISDHPRGAGVTARWTVPHHWLAYDSDSGKLGGSD